MSQLLVNAFLDGDEYKVLRNDFVERPISKEFRRALRKLRRKFGHDYVREYVSPRNLLPVASLAIAQASQAGASNSTAPTSILPAPAKYTFAPNYFSQIGRMLRLTITGQISNVVTTPGTLTLTVNLGPTSNIIVFNGGAMQMSTTAHTTFPFTWEVWLTLRAVGSGTSANIMGQSRATGQMMSATAVADSTTSHGVLLAPNSTPAVGTGFDSTVQNILDVIGTFSVNTSGTNITLTQMVLEDLSYIQP